MESNKIALFYEKMIKKYPDQYFLELAHLTHNEHRLLEFLIVALFRFL